MHVHMRIYSMHYLWLVCTHAICDIGIYSLMNMKAAVTPPNFACTDCGQVYESHFPCVCPFCRSGVKNQTRIDSVDLFKRKFYTHESSPTNYRSKFLEKNPEYLLDIPDMQASIEAYQDSPVTIDWLSFSFSLANLRHCTRSTAFSGIPFPQAPVLPPVMAKSSNDAVVIQDFHQKLYTEYFEDVLRMFIQRVLGFSYGSMKGVGFNFYEDSFILMSEDGDDYCGQVGIGGNNGTVHFSIPASGCKHLFSNRSREFVHHWLANILGVTLLTRVDLAFDDFDDLHTCKASLKAYMVGGFKRSRGINPKVKCGDEWALNADNESVFNREEMNYGSRQSLVYWRIYNKKLERKIDKEGFTWYRSEVELKKYTVDVLLDPAGHFVGLNEYAASVLSVTVEPITPNAKSKKRIVCDVIASAVHLKKQYGRIVNSLFNLFHGDCEKVISMLVRDDVVLAFPSTHQQLVNSLE